MTGLEFHGILNFKMSNSTLQPRFVKPFSRGQVTLPKIYRDYLGIDEASWLKVSLWNGQILLKPVKESQAARKIRPVLGKKTYLKALSAIKGDWLNQKEMKKIRTAVEKRLAKNEKSLT